MTATTKSGITEAAQMSRKISPENNLASRFPSIAEEWHPTQNGDLLPEKVFSKSAQIVAWLCTNGHTWTAPIYSRTRGHSCPYCSGRLVMPNKSIAATHPQIVAEWHPDKNGQVSPQTVSAGSHKKVWWRCQLYGHEWRSYVFSRTKLGTGCPKCVLSSSTHELRLFCELRHIFQDTCHKSKIAGKEFDIFIPSLAVAIEVDGYPWHSTLLQKDLNKNAIANQTGVHLIRVRHEHLPQLGPEDIIFKNSERELTFDTYVRVLLRIRQIVPIKASVITQLIEEGTFRATKHYLEMVGFTKRTHPDRSIEASHPLIAAQWDSAKNGGLTPRQFSAGSVMKVWWKCQNNHSWLRAIQHRCRGSGKCPTCEPRQANAEINLALTHPNIATDWDVVKNGRTTPEQVVAGSSKPVWWTCKRGHSYRTRPTRRIASGGCKICRGKMRRPKRVTNRDVAGRFCR